MIGHSTRAKRRRQASNWKVVRLRVVPIDSRVDCWLVSYPLTKPQHRTMFDPYRAPQYYHTQVYGFKETGKVYGRIRQRILSGGS